VLAEQVVQLVAAGCGLGEQVLVIQALKAAAGGLFYLTVEEVDEPVIEQAFTTLTRRGLPAVRGEVIDGDVAGYHHYPGRDRVTGWLHAAGLQVIDEGFNQEDGWGYRHFLLQSTSQ
jgi:hypothetical protein